MSVLSSGDGFVISDERAVIRFEHMGRMLGVTRPWRWGSDGVGGEDSKGVGLFGGPFLGCAGVFELAFMGLGFTA